MAQRTVITSKRQSLYDIAVQELGNVAAVVELAVLNDVATTYITAPGEQILVPESAYKRKEVAEYFKLKKIKVATAINPQLEPVVPGGIGYMAIGVNFIVS